MRAAFAGTRGAGAQTARFERVRVGKLAVAASEVVKSTVASSRFTPSIVTALMLPEAPPVSSIAASVCTSAVCAPEDLVKVQSSVPETAVSPLAGCVPV